MEQKSFFYIFIIFGILILLFFLLKWIPLTFDHIEGIFLKVIEYKNKDYLQFFLIILILNFMYFISPLPVFFIIVFNRFIFGNYCFLFSIFFVCFGSFLIFIFSQKFLKQKISNLFNFDFINKKIKKFNFIKKTNNNIIFLSRYIIPYFFHNVIFSLYKLDVKKFIFIIFLAEIPTTLAINNIGKSLNNFILINDYRIYDLFFDKLFVIWFIFILFIMLMAGVIEKIILKKSKKNI